MTLTRVVLIIVLVWLFLVTVSLLFLAIGNG